jgi:hypothetical protein
MKRRKFFKNSLRTGIALGAVASSTLMPNVVTSKKNILG